jgi:hypothetical protein
MIAVPWRQAASLVRGATLRGDANALEVTDSANRDVLSAPVDHNLAELHYEASSHASWTKRGTGDTGRGVLRRSASYWAVR